MYTKVLLSVLALALTTFATPIAEPPSQLLERETEAPSGVAIHGAFNVQAACPSVTVSPGPEYLTLTLINSHTADLTTKHTRATNVPAPVGGPIPAGTLTGGQTASFAVPTGYIGNIAVNDGNPLNPITDNDSLIEFNYVEPCGYNAAVADVDISYVRGFSVALVCSCSGQVVTGCNKDLFALGNTCAEPDNEGACINPYANNTTTTEATPFFQPCQHAAISYPNDAGNSFNQCQSGQITCCVGTACPANPAQPQ